MDIIIPEGKTLIVLNLTDYSVMENISVPYLFISDDYIEGEAMEGLLRKVFDTFAQENPQDVPHIINFADALDNIPDTYFQRFGLTPLNPRNAVTTIDMNEYAFPESALDDQDEEDEDE